MVNSVDDTRGQCGDNGVKFLLSEIGHDQLGFEALARLHAQTKDCFLEDIEIDMHAAKWFAADMCAAFGAILYELGRKLNTVRLVGVTGEVAETLSKNGFLSHYGRAKLPDSWGAAVSYRRFDTLKIDEMMSAYGAGHSDFNDQIIAQSVRKRGADAHHSTTPISKHHGIAPFSLRIARLLN